MVIVRRVELNWPFYADVYDQCPDYISGLSKESEDRGGGGRPSPESVGVGPREDSILRREASRQRWMVNRVPAWAEFVGARIRSTVL